MWLRVPFTFCPSAPEAGDSISAWNWRCPLLASSVALRGKPTAERSWTRAWKNKPWLMRLSGRICEPSTAARGVARFIASLPDIPASLSALRASDLALTIPGISGRTCGASLAKWDRNTCSWKTSQGTLFSDSTRSLESLPRTGLMRAGQLCGLPTWAPPTGGNGCSSWPTPDTQNFRDGTHQRAEAKGSHAVSLHHKVAQWQTPSVADTTGGHLSRGGKRSNELLLRGQAKAFWQTPKTPTGGPEQRESKATRGAGGIDLETESRNWPTPGANDFKGSAQDGQRRGQLDEAAEQKFHPSRPALTISTPGLPSSPTTPNSRRRLNPRFVEHLMGWPLGWTDCGCSATEWSRLKPLWRSLISGMF